MRMIWPAQYLGRLWHHKVIPAAAPKINSRCGGKVASKSVTWLPMRTPEWGVVTPSNIRTQADIHSAPRSLGLAVDVTQSALPVATAGSSQPPRR